MSDLRELYQEMILEHNKQPRNFRVMADATHTAEGYNPLCGDRLKLFMAVDGGTIKDISFQGSGCAISKASASMMTAALKGKTTAEAEGIFEAFHHMLAPTHSGTPREDRQKDLGKLTVFSGVGEFPTRVKCATLAWHTLRSGLKGEPQAVSTEE